MKISRSGRNDAAFDESLLYSEFFRDTKTKHVAAQVCTHLLEAGDDIRNDVKTTMIYTYVANRGVLGVRSPLDELQRGR